MTRPGQSEKSTLPLTAVIGSEMTRDHQAAPMRRLFDCETDTRLASSLGLQRAEDGSPGLKAALLSHGRDQPA